MLSKLGEAGFRYKGVINLDVAERTGQSVFAKEAGGGMRIKVIQITITSD